MVDVLTENSKLRERLATITAEAAANEKIMRKSQRRELDLLNAGSLAELLGRLIAGLGDSFGLSAVTLVLCDPHHEIRHLLMNSGTDPDGTEGVLYVDSMLGLTPTYATLRRPWLGPYIGADHQLIFPGRSGLGSVALLPLLRHERQVGCLNFGAADTKRFTRYHATDFLHHLAVIAAFCLENTVNRERLVRAGLSDSLTGWHNRRYLDNRLREEVVGAQRYFQPLACLMIDIDRFKRVNDEYGHVAGDNVLREVADRVKTHVRGSDVAVRYGGEEFVLLLPRTDLEAAKSLAERIRQAVSARPIAIDPSTALTVTISVGAAAVTPARKASELKRISEALIAEADEALYRAKSDGRDRVRTAAG